MLCIFLWLYTDKEQDEIDNEIINSFIDECFKNKKTMEQQTAVEWYAEQDNLATIDFIEGRINQIALVRTKATILEKAKQLEKNLIMNAYMKNLPIKDGVITAVQKAENYYNETFKTK